MATGPNDVLSKGHLAEGTAAYFRGEIVVRGAAEQSAAKATAAGALPLGVTIESVRADYLTEHPGKVFVGVKMMGIAEVIAGGAFTKGQQVMTDANGKAVVATAGNAVLGIAETAGVADQYSVVTLTPGVYKA